MNDPAKLRDDIFEIELRDAWAENKDGAHDIAHIHRVWRNVCDIAQGEGGADMDVLRPATVFHDLVNLAKDDPERHTASKKSAVAARKILERLEISDDRIAKIEHAIIAHSFSADIPPETREARILQDADRLDALGAIGVARTMYVAGSMGRWLYHLRDPMGHDREGDDVKYALDHFQAKLLRLGENMNTATGIRLAQERTAFMEEFMTRIEDEIG